MTRGRLGSESLRIRFLCLVSWGRERDSMPSLRFSSSKSEKKGNAVTKSQRRRDLYEVLSVGCNATDQEIKSAYCKLALKQDSLIILSHLHFISFFVCSNPVNGNVKTSYMQGLCP